MARVYLTGFSCFKDVPVNPTECLVRRLAADEEQVLLGCHILRVAAGEVGTWLHTTLPQQLAAKISGKGPLVVVHLGVDVHGDCIKLERQAVNDATFRVPDEDGWQPREAAISDADALHHVRHTGLPLDHIIDSMPDCNVVVSEDAGRFVCNFAYYVSLVECHRLRREAGMDVQALFVHLPTFERMPEEVQFRWLRVLLKHIAAAAAAPCRPVGPN